MPLVSNCACSKLWQDNKLKESNYICAGAENVGGCHIDDGLPLMMKDGDQWFVVGIGGNDATNCGEKGYPDIYRRVDRYLDWIEKNI